MSRDEMLACPNCEGRGRRTISEAGCCNNPTRTGECCGNAIEVQAEEPCDSCGGTGLSASLLDGSVEKIVQSRSADGGQCNEQSGKEPSPAIPTERIIGYGNSPLEAIRDALETERKRRHG